MRDKRNVNQSHGNALKQKARNTNTSFFGRKADDFESPEDCLKFNRVLPAKQRDQSNILTYLNYDLQRQSTGDNPYITGVDNVGLLIAREALKQATREPLEPITTARCPVCKKDHPIKCPDHGPHEIMAYSALADKNKTTALMKWMDKFFASKAAVSKDVDLEAEMKKIGANAAQFILKFVPPENQTEALNAFQEMFLKGVEKLG